MRFCLPANAFYLLAWYSKLPLTNPRNRVIRISETKTPIQVSGSEFFHCLGLVLAILGQFVSKNGVIGQKMPAKNERNYSKRLLAGIAVFAGMQR